MAIVAPDGRTPLQTAPRTADRRKLSDFAQLRDVAELAVAIKRMCAYLNIPDHVLDGLPPRGEAPEVNVSGDID